ncbi:hypothetical protein SAMN05421641_11528 [Paracoccus thiocyanatus]|uniref:Polymerase/histidinol phosphatase N-terminal domain-containing protein n=1 Tax=Paracoccus thiocyanatus TaxID=34006 RepID=A0A1N6VYS3_9RHOB|nr:CehA/McbA family metallohydrolase [Paracoccus thiocyanatus]SIQ82918.1 hypothetical protein SAMN05421641_11528 [Paracoccus thiocyanatus]
MSAFSPFDLPGPFLKGNIHTHSNLSDGTLAPQEVAARYRAAGYDFLSITDHFLKSCDFPITDISDLETADFTPIFGAELHAPRTEMSDLWHLVAVGLPPDFAPTADHEDGPALARRAHAAGAFVGIAHPAWYQLSMDDAETLLDAAHAVEIYNHGCQIMHDKGDGAYLLDGLADKGHRLLAYACDDAHFRTPDFGGGWVMLKARDRSADAIVSALKAGQFYSTQGPSIQNIRFQDDRLLVECSPAAGILIAGQGYQHSYHFEAGVSRAELSLDGLRGSPWLRVIVFGPDGKRAWSNPFWL